MRWSLAEEEATEYAGDDGIEARPAGRVDGPVLDKK